MRFILGVLAGAFAARAYGRDDVKQRVSGYGSQLKSKLLDLGILKQKGVNTGEVGSTEYGTSASYESPSTGSSSYGSASTSGGFGSSSVSSPPYGRH